MDKKLILPKNPTLRDFQKYIAKMIKVRGFKKEKSAEIFLLLLEECGELAKAARKSIGIHVDKNSMSHNVGHEAADVFMMLLHVCLYHKIDLEKAFREKEEINNTRSWR